MSRPTSSRNLITLGIVCGLLSGLVEGGVHMGLHRLNVLNNAWYPIIWIAAAFNAVLVGAAAALAAAVTAWRPQSAPLRAASLFGVFLLALIPAVALMLKEWIYTYAIVLLCVGMATVLTRWHLQRESWPLSGGRALRWTIGAALAAFLIIEGGGRVHERWATARLPQAVTSAPDVLLVIVDTLRSDHLASYGYHRQTSPRIDALASGGVLFESSFATSSYTLPSHVSMLTGQFPHEHQVEWGASHRWSPAAGVPLPEVLLAKGYRTGAFSANTFYFTREHGFGRGFLHFEDFFHSVEDAAWRTAYGAIATRIGRKRRWLEDLPGRKLAAEVSTAASRWIARDSSRPFFVAVNYMDTHDPYLPPQPYRGRFGKTANPGGLINAKVHIPRSLPPEQLQRELDAYDGAIAYVDDQISRLLSSIQSMSRPRDLLVIVTSDHGEEFGEHGGFLHQRHLYREVIQVPLIVWQPGRIPGGLRITTPVSNAAIPATVLDLLGGGSRSFPVPSLRALWEGVHTEFPAPRSDLKHMPWAFPGDAPIRFGSMRSVVADGWHYIEQDRRPPELFDRRTDPQEKTNVATSPRLQDVVNDLKRRLK